jgi:hypothetical protein
MINTMHVNESALRQPSAATALAFSYRKAIILYQVMIVRALLIIA